MAQADPVPGNLPLFMKRGVHFGPLTFIFKDSNGVVINLTGYTPRAIARPETGSPNQFDLEPAVTDAAAGKVVMEFTDAETQRDFPSGRYDYDMTLEQSGEIYGPYLVGQFTVADHPSRS